MTTALKKIGRDRSAGGGMKPISRTRTGITGWLWLAPLGRVLINRQQNADLDVPPNVRYRG